MPVQLRHHLGDRLLGDLLSQQRAMSGLVPLEGSRCFFQLAVQANLFPVAQLSGTLQVAVALGTLGALLGALDLLLGLPDAGDQLLLALPGGLHGGDAFLELGEFLLDLAKTFLRGAVLLLGEGALLDLEPEGAALKLVDLGGKGVDLDAKTGGRLVHQVDGLVRQEAVGDVPVGESGGGHDRRVRDAHAVVDLVLLLEAAQDRNRLLDRGLPNEDRLETPFQGGVLLDVLAVLREGRCADGAQLAPRESGLEEVGGVDRALCGPGPHQGVDLVDEQNHRALGVHHLLDHRLQAVLELAAVLGAGDQRPQVERHDLPPLEQLGHVPVGDAARQPLGHGRLADPGLADEHRVVLGAAVEDLHDTADLVVAPDHRVELARAGQLREVAAVLLERLELSLRVLVGHAVRATHLLDGGKQRVAADAVAREELRRGAPRHRGDGEQQVLDRDVLVLELGGELGCRLEDRAEVAGGLRLGTPLGGGQAAQSLYEVFLQARKRRADLLQQPGSEPFLLLEEGLEQVCGGRLGVAPAGGRPQRLLERLTRLDREVTVGGHVTTSSLAHIRSQTVST